jgi:hypothetical protein
MRSNADLSEDTPTSSCSTRRAFLQQAAVSSLAVGSALESAAMPQQDASRPRATGRGPHLFLDDFLIAEQTNVRREVVPPPRLPQPVVTGPEDKCFQPYMTVVRDAETKRFRIWYGVPVNASQSHLATLESNDGIHWERPHRVLEDAGRIDFGCSILDEGPNFPQPDRRYKYAWWHDGGLQIAASPDGLRWKKIAPGPVLKHNHDINNIYRDPLRNRYVVNVSMYLEGDGWRGQRRVTYQSESDDLLRWSNPHRIVTPDAQDEGETQFYCMGGVLARGDLLIGMARVLRDDLPAEPGGVVAGLGYTTLTWSRDGQNWTRDRTPFLDRSAVPGAWDRAMTWVDCQLPMGNEVYLYYGGYKGGHKVERFTERQIGLARMPLDRYVARTAGVDTGAILTHPVRFAGTRLTLNAEVKESLQVGVYDLEGRPLPGFRPEDCRVVRGDSLRHVVRWPKAPTELKEKTVRLRFHFRQARLFGFTFEE